MMKDPTRLRLAAEVQEVQSRRYRIGSVALHWHDFYEIELVTDGVGTHTVNGKPYEWRRGEMHLMRPVDVHEIALEAGGEVHLIQIKPALIPQEFLESMRDGSAVLLTYLSEGEMKQIDALCTVLEEGERYDPRLAEHVLSAILTIFFRRIEPAPSAPVKDGLLGQILLYIGENLRGELSLAGLAEQFFISRNYLCSYFKKRMGRTVLAYVKECRLGYAARLLLSTRLKSIEVCEACGYGSVSNFLRDFKAAYGLSPTAFRERGERAK